MIFLSSIPIIEGPPEEISMDREQFELLAVHTDNEIDLLINRKAVSKYGADHYFMYQRTAGEDKYFSVGKSGDFAADNSIPEEIAIVPSIVFSRGVVRIYDDNIYTAGFYQTAAGFNFVRAKSVDGGANWVSATDATVDADHKYPYLLDIIEIGGVDWYVFKGEAADHSIPKIHFFKYDLSGTITGTELDDVLSIYSGYFDYANGIYYWIEYRTDSKFYKCSFNGTAISTITEMTDFSVPLSWDIDSQLYHKQNNLEILMDNTHLYIYDSKSATWTVKTVGTETTKNAPFYDKNSSDEYIITFLAWDDQIWKIFKNGIGSMQTISGYNVLCAYKDWFCTGSAIYIKVP